MSPPLTKLSFLFLSLFTSLRSEIITLSPQFATTAIKLPQPSPTFSVTDYGAVGDGTTYDTTSIQSAIDDCSTSGGGTVLFPTGKSYLTATVFLKSGVELEIEKGARILGGTKLGDYPVESWRWYVVVAENATDVGISGGGVIDGQGMKFVERVDVKKNVMVSWNRTGACYGDECRPRLVGFIGCRNVRVWNVNLTQPAYWCLHIVRCQNTTIDNVSIYGDFNTPNNDGIDIEDSNNTLITHCTIDTGDDAICPKTYTAPLHNLTAKDTWIRTKSSAIKLGSASYFNFHHLVFDNVTIVDSHRGLALQIRDGGNVSDVTFSNINVKTRYYDMSWWGRAEPIYVTNCQRDYSSPVGYVNGLLFVNITAESENGVFLSGCGGGGLISDLVFDNVELVYRRRTNYTGGLVDYRPGCQGLVEHSSAGIIMEYIEGLEFRNVKMRWYDEEELKGWNNPLDFNPLDFNPSTVNNISMLSFSSGLYQY